VRKESAPACPYELVFARPPRLPADIKLGLTVSSTLSKPSAEYLVQLRRDLEDLQKSLRIEQALPSSKAARARTSANEDKSDSEFVEG
jgi:hypothetical protein